MAVINTNVNALFAQNALNNTSKLQSQAMQQLSSGLRINSARDDAAGIAIATRMTSQIGGLNQAIQNSNDAVTLIQTADGATSSITTMMQRMRDLALEAANGTEDDTQRGYLDIEFQQLKQQIVDISNQTQWNGMDILNGTAGQRVGEMPVYKATSNNLDGSVFINPTTGRTIGGADAGEIQTFTLSGTPAQGTITIGGQAVTITPADVAGGMSAVMQEIQNTLGQNSFFGGNSGRSVTTDPVTNTVTLNYTSTDGAVPLATVDPGSTGMSVSPTTVQRPAVTDTSEVFSNNGKFLKSGSLTMSVANGGNVVTANFLTSDNKTIPMTGTIDTSTGQITFAKADGRNDEVITDNLTYTFKDSNTSALDLDTTPRALSLSVDVQGSIPTMRSGDLIINGTVIGPSQASDDTVSPPNNAAGSAIAKAAAINRAAVDQGITQGEEQSLTVNGTPSPGTITVAGVSVVITSSDQTPAAVAKKIALALQASAQFGSPTGRVVTVAQGSNIVNITYPVSDGNAPALTYDGGSTGVTGVSNVTTPYATSKPGTGVFAKVNPNIETGQQMDDSTVVSGVVYVNGYASAQVTNVLDNPQATRANVVKAINQISDKTGVKAIDSGADDKGITLVAQDGRNIEVSFQTAANANVFGAAMGLNEGVQCSTVSLESKIDSPIVLTNSPTGDISRVGLTQGDFTKNQSVLNTAPRAPVQALVPQQESVEISGTVNTGLSSTVIVNGVNFTSDTTFTNPQDMRDNLISKINTDTTLGVYATSGSDGGQIILTARTAGVPFTMSATSSDPTHALGVTTHEIAPNTPPQFKALQTNDLQINGIKIRQSVAADDTSSQSIANSSDPASSAIAVAAAINASSSQTGVTAQANPVVSVGSNTMTDVPASGKQSLYINGVQIQVNFTQGESAADRRTNVMNAINQVSGEDGVTATDNGSGLTLSSDGRNMSVWYDSSVPGLSAASFGLDKGGATAQVSKVTFAGSGSSTSNQVMINGVAVQGTGGATPADSATSMMNAINHMIPALNVTASIDSSDPSSVIITSNVPGSGFDLRGAASDTGSSQTISLSTVTANSEGNNDISGVNLTQAYSQNVLGGGNANANVRTLYGTVKLVAAAPNLPAISGEDGLPNPSLNLSGDPIQITTGSNGVGDTSHFSQLGFQEGGFGGRASEDMDPPKVGRLSFQVGSGANMAITIDLPDFGSGGSITGDITGDISKPVDQRTVRINTQDAASGVLNMLDASLDKINAVRANMGAVMNRLDYTVSNLTNVSNNMTTSRSSIQDADYATASTNLAKSQIMQQAATAVLAQANTAQQTVLKLLGG